MKPIVLALCSLFLIFSCRGDSEDVQKIDQLLHIYLKNTDGQDLMNSSLDGSYSSVSLLDIGGLYDQSSISGYSLVKDDDAVYYLKYTAGATRNFVDSVSADYKTYRSDIILELTDSDTDSVDLDTISVFYDWTPQVFKVSSFYYNGTQLNFAASDGDADPNIVNITK